MLDTSRSLKLARAALALFVALPLGTVGCAEDPPTGSSIEEVGTDVMLGNTNVEAADDNAAGYAYAFKYTAAQTGTVDGLRLYVGAGNQAQTIRIGLYGDSGTNHPGALLTSGTLSQPAASAWNQAAVTAAQVTQGKTYWIAILSPAGGGTIHLRARGGASGSNETAAGSFSNLPGTWTPGTQWSGAAMSAVALGSTTTPPPPPPTGQTLVGNAAVASVPDDTGGGEAYAFKYTAAKSGKVDALRLYVDAGNAAQTIQLGLYTNNNGHPGTKLTGGTITNPTPSQWNRVAVPTVDVASGGTYWIALLSPAGGGRPRVRAEGGATAMNESASGSFSNLPGTWVNGPQWSGKNLSATADGVVSDTGGGVPTLAVTTVVSGLTIPWDLGFTPDGTMLYTERPGSINALVNGTKRRLATPADVVVASEAGMLGLAIDPQFASNRRIYVCLASTLPAGADDVRVARFRVDAGYTALAERVDIVTGLPVNTAGDLGRHSGCRLRFGPDGYLWVGTGDAAVGTVPQDDNSLGGKVLRVTTDGAAAPNNPGGRRWFTKGHRNVQGLAFQPGTNRLYAVEHGPAFDDEINLIVAGGNYGWDPVPGYNENVPMTNTSKFPQARQAAWRSGSSTFATSGAEFLIGTQWRDWNGAMAVATLKEQDLRIFTISSDGSTATQRAVLFNGTYGRLRTPVRGPDGALYVTTANGGGADKILRITAN